MPEGPELHLASLFVNRMCEGVVFSGGVEKSEVSKCKEVAFACDAYGITATSRGKEVRLTLTPMKSDKARGKARAGQGNQPMDIVFRFGMSGFFRFTAEEEVHKHAHLRFYTNENPRRVLSFVDARRFGGWQPDGTWQSDRGPCILFEYKDFRENVLANLSDRAFDKPICEVLLNQKYFNGIGNYLRAEILFRLNIPPFVKARTVLEGLQSGEMLDSVQRPTKEEDTTSELPDKEVKKEIKVKGHDLLSLCHTVPLEIVELVEGGKGYDPEKGDYSAFKLWLQCYYVDGMKSLRDHNGRTIWFRGDPGPMAPKDSKSPKARKMVKKEEHDYTEKKKVSRKRRSESGPKEKVEKQKTPKKRKKSKEESQQEQIGMKRGKPGRGNKKHHPGKQSSSPSGAAVPTRRSERVTRARESQSC